MVVRATHTQSAECGVTISLSYSCCQCAWSLTVMAPSTHLCVCVRGKKYGCETKRDREKERQIEKESVCMMCICVFVYVCARGKDIAAHSVRCQVWLSELTLIIVFTAHSHHRQLQPRPKPYISKTCNTVHDPELLLCHQQFSHWLPRMNFLSYTITQLGIK